MHRYTLQPSRCVPAGFIFALLANGHIHVWKLSLKGAPKLIDVWTHVAKEKPTCMAVAEPSILMPEILDSWSMPPLPEEREAWGPLLLCGTQNGTIVVCDVEKRGNMVCRLPLFEAAANYQARPAAVLMSCLQRSVLQQIETDVPLP